MTTTIQTTPARRRHRNQSGLDSITLPNSAEFDEVDRRKKPANKETRPLLATGFT
jgi:hypothetical protein